MSGRKRALLASSWSDLPQEITSKIEIRLRSAVDVFHLRSVCKNWRSSRNPNNTSILSPLFPLIIPNVDLPFTNRARAPLTLVARAVFLVKPLQSPSDSCGWLLTVEEMVPGKLRILYPLSKNHVKDLSSDFPKYLDLSKFRVSRVAKRYGLKYESDGEEVPSVRRVVLCSENTVLVLFGKGILIGLRLKGGNWSYVRHSIINGFSDVISSGRNHVRAVDFKGNVHIIDHRVLKVVKSIFPASEIHESNQIRLIRSNGKLCAAAFFPRRMKLEIYRLDKVHRKWIKDVNTYSRWKVLFISSDWSFFVHTRDLDLRHYSPTSNQTEQKKTMREYYVIYSKHAFNFNPSAYTIQLYEVAGLDLEIGVYFCNYNDLTFWKRAPCYSTTIINVLWPPPTWFWPDTYSLTRNDEKLDIHSHNELPFRKQDLLPSSTANASTSVNKKVLIEQLKDIRNSHAPAIQLSQEKDSTVSFQGIEVKSEHVPILKEVWKKHGNVLEGSVLQSSGLKAMALVCLAKLLTILQTPGEGFTTDEIAYIESTLADLQIMRLKIGWLVPFVEIILPLHKKLQADMEVIEEAKAQAEKTREKLLAGMTEVKQGLDMDV